MPNVKTLRHVYEAVLAVETAVGVAYSEREHVCTYVGVYGLSYSACKLHALYCCHMWPVWLHHVFPHSVINDDFWKKDIERKMCVLIFSKNISHFKSNSG
jgi:hypothetical protein